MTYFKLAAGQVVFINPDGNPGSVSVNTLLRSESPQINLKGLQDIQIGIQQSFAQKLDEESRNSIQVVDIIIMSISDLGMMTEEEFNTANVEEPTAPQNDALMAHHLKQ